jgi:hypothetical protein
MSASSQIQHFVLATERPLPAAPVSTARDTGQGLIATSALSIGAAALVTSAQPVTLEHTVSSQMQQHAAVAAQRLQMELAPTATHHGQGIAASIAQQRRARITGSLNLVAPASVRDLTTVLTVVVSVPEALTTSAVGMGIATTAVAEMEPVPVIADLQDLPASLVSRTHVLHTETRRTLVGVPVWITGVALIVPRPPFHVTSTVVGQEHRVQVGSKPQPGFKAPADASAVPDGRHHSVTSVRRDTIHKAAQMNVQGVTAILAVATGYVLRAYREMAPATARLHTQGQRVNIQTQ